MNKSTKIKFINFLAVSSTPYRKNSIYQSCVSPELIWPAPETFSCLESLGASMNDDLPYEVFGLNSTNNCFERVRKNKFSILLDFYLTI